MNFKLAVYLLLGVLLLKFVSAATPSQVITNSQDWRDVYSAMLYGSLTGYKTDFLVSDRHSILFLNSVPKGKVSGRNLYV